MEIRDEEGAYHMSYRGTVLTFDGYVHHPAHGYVRAKIRRSVGNDCAYRQLQVLAFLSQKEPDVGFWKGDVIQYYSDEGRLIEEIR